MGVSQSVPTDIKYAKTDEEHQVCKLFSRTSTKKEKWYFKMHFAFASSRRNEAAIIFECYKIIQTPEGVCKGLGVGKMCLKIYARVSHMPKSTLFEI